MIKVHLHLVSDSTGETVRSVARACLAQFDPEQVVHHLWPMARTERAIAQAMENVVSQPGPVIFTLIDHRLRQQLVDACQRIPTPCVSILDPVITTLSGLLGAQAQARPGLQHVMDEAYFRRIEAMQWTVAHDDGVATHELEDADVVLVGVSRTSKTPTCIYLANQGIRAANVPFVPGTAVPQDLDRLTHPLVLGLTKAATQLVQARRVRLDAMQHAAPSAYVDLEEVRREIADARRYFTQRGWPILDVSRRAIEETAAEVMRLMAQRTEPQASSGSDGRALS